jgi:hypothetical protein
MQKVGLRGADELCLMVSFGVDPMLSDFDDSKHKLHHFHRSIASGQREAYQRRSIFDFFGCSSDLYRG